MDFSDALINIRVGRKVGRSAWGTDGPYLFYVPASTFVIEAERPLGKASPDLVGATAYYRPHIDVRTPAGYVMPWTPGQDDLLGADWFVLLSEQDMDTLSGQHPAGSRAVTDQDASGPGSPKSRGKDGGR